MPNRPSAKKQMRQNEQNRVLNKARKTEIKTLRKQVDRAVHDGKADEAETLLRRYVQRVDQAAVRNILHKNTASRRKALMAKHVATLAQA